MNILGRIFITVLIGYFFSIHQVYADIIINEIAWMGTEISANHEWIELYNTTDQDIDINGWALRAQDGTPNIIMTGKFFQDSSIIPANSFMVLERTSDASMPSVDAFGIYTGALGNQGESLELLNSDGTVVDSVLMSDGWIAGSSTSKETMQRISSNRWVTATDTPAKMNTFVEILTDDNEQEVDEYDLSSESVTEQKVTKTWEEIFGDTEKKFTGSITHEKVIIAGIPSMFSYDVIRNKKNPEWHGLFRINFGDGNSIEHTKRQEFSYVYEHAGDYIISFEYYESILSEKPVVRHEKLIRIVDPQFTLDYTPDMKGIIITNNSNVIVDLGDWILKRHLGLFVFPKRTLIKPKGSIILNTSKIDPVIGNFSLRLYNPLGVIHTTYTYGTHNEIPANKVTTQSYDYDDTNDNPSNFFQSESDKKSYTFSSAYQNDSSPQVPPWLIGVFIFLATSILSVFGYVFWIVYKNKQKIHIQEKSFDESEEYEEYFPYEDDE